MKVRNIPEAKAELSALIEEVQKGSDIIIAKAGKPVARLVASWTRPSADAGIDGRRDLDR